MEGEMLRKKYAFFSFNNPEVIEERNKRIAERIGKKIGYNAEKIRDMCNKINIMTKDSTPQNLLEYLYKKLMTAKTGISREYIQKIIVTCHEEAFGWLRNTYQDLRDG
jgi:hypothetical protein